MDFKPNQTMRKTIHKKLTQGLTWENGESEHLLQIKTINFPATFRNWNSPSVEKLTIKRGNNYSG